MPLATVRRRTLLALILALGFIALRDSLLCQRIFGSHGLSAFDPEYQTGHVAILVGMMAVGAILLLDSGWWALWYQGALYTFAFGGVEDVLYYWLDGRAIPGLLPWLDPSRLILVRPLAGAVTSVEPLASAALWLTLSLSVVVLGPRS